jgi:hypothetical protein
LVPERLAISFGLKGQLHRSEDTEMVKQATVHPAGVKNPFGLASIGHMVAEKRYPPPNHSLADGISPTASRIAESDTDTSPG